jgi:AcrR family transcriptional regulator
MSNVSELPRRTQLQRRVEAEIALVHAAAEIIAEGGSAAVTLVKVGERAGYSRGLANHHFGNKANLMARVVDEVSEAFIDLITSQPSDSSVTQELFYLIDIYIGIIKKPRAINRARLVLIAESITYDFEYRDVIIEGDRTFRSRLTKSFERGIALGEFPADIDAIGLSSVVIALLRGVAWQVFTDPQLDINRARSEIKTLLNLRLGISPISPFPLDNK